MGNAMSVKNDKQPNVKPDSEQNPKQQVNPERKRSLRDLARNVNNKTSTGADNEDFTMSDQVQPSLEVKGARRPLRSSGRFLNRVEASPPPPQTPPRATAKAHGKRPDKSHNVPLPPQAEHETNGLSETAARASWVKALDVARAEMMEYIHSPVDGVAGIKNRREECRKHLLATFDERMIIPPPSTIVHDSLLTVDQPESVKHEVSSDMRTGPVGETPYTTLTRSAAKAKTMAKMRRASNTDNASEIESASDAGSMSEAEPRERKRNPSFGAKKPVSWSTEEDDACIKHMKAVTAIPEFNGLESRFAEVSRRMTVAHGFARSTAAVKSQWNRRLRKLSKFEDRSDRRRSAALITSALSRRFPAGVGPDQEEVEADEIDSPPMRTRSDRKRSRAHSPDEPRKKTTPSVQDIDQAPPSIAGTSSAPQPKLKLFLRRKLSAPEVHIVESTKELTAELESPEEQTIELESPKESTVEPDVTKQSTVEPDVVRESSGIDETVNASQILFMAADDDSESADDEDTTTTAPAVKTLDGTSEQKEKVPKSKDKPTTDAKTPGQRRKSAAGISKPHWTTAEDHACVVIMKDLFADPSFTCATARYEECSRRLAEEPYNMNRNSKAIFSRWIRHLHELSGIDDDNE